MEPIFEQAIHEHLELQRRNAALEGSMPLERYRLDDVIEKHPLFKSEAEARLEENPAPAEPDGGWPSSQSDTGIYPPDDFWAATPAFDWGD